MLRSNSIYNILSYVRIYKYAISAVSKVIESPSLTSSTSTSSSLHRLHHLGTELVPHAVDAVNLAGSELGPAGTMRTGQQIVHKIGKCSHLRRRVVHVVVDRVQAGVVGAGVTAVRAAGAGTRLGRGIIDVVAGAIAVVTVEGVGETEPVTSLVGADEADGVLGQGAAIAHKGIRALRGAGRVVAVSRGRGEDVDDVEVHRLVAALAESSLHGHLLAVALVGPVGVDGLGASGVVHVDAVGAEGVAEGVELKLEIRVGAETTLGGRDGVEVDIDANGSLGNEAGLAGGLLLDRHLPGDLDELLTGLGRAASDPGRVNGRAHGHAGKEDSRLDRHFGEEN